MGKAPEWTAKEREHASIAWFRATNNGIEGVNQRNQDFRNKVFDFFKVLAPMDALPGRYGDRSANSVYIYLRDKIFPSINKFNESLLLVQSSHPTGVNDDNIISMAIALYLGKTKRMDYNFKTFEHTNWVNFLAWKILRDCPKFRPPSPLSQTESFSDAMSSMLHRPSYSSSLPAPASSSIGNMAVDTTNTTDSGTADEHVVDGDPLPTASSSSAAATMILDPSRGGRGALMGCKKAKLEHQKMAVNAERNKRLKNIEDKLIIQAEQQIRMGRVFELRQYLKTALLTGDKRAAKKIGKELMDMYRSSSKKAMDEAEDDDESTTTTTSAPSNESAARDFYNDDDDDIPPMQLNNVSSH
jgi:hypothetical protein